MKLIKIDSNERRVNNHSDRMKIIETKEKDKLLYLALKQLGLID